MILCHLPLFSSASALVSSLPGTEQPQLELHALKGGRQQVKDFLWDHLYSFIPPIKLCLCALAEF